MIDCAQCCGLCCVALYCARSEGFPADKPPGKPCPNLREDFRCGIHDALARRKLHGCMAFDCLGAGQAVTKRFGNWAEGAAVSEAFLPALRLRQLQWYLRETLSLLPARELWEEAGALARENERLMERLPVALGELERHRLRVRGLLDEAGKRVGIAAGGGPVARGGREYLGKDFRRARSEGRDFSMSLLIAANFEGRRLVGANFLGADLRDTNLRGADLSESVFLTQGQINAARGDERTRLPKWLSRPVTWG